MRKISWLGVCFWNITFTEDLGLDVKEIRELLYNESVAEGASTKS
jgi:hypothetical protein